MIVRCICISVVLGIACLIIPMDASAITNNPGSILIFPYYNTQGSGFSIITITNVGGEEIWIRLVWLAESD
jgi:hypothetical protein